MSQEHQPQSPQPTPEKEPLQEMAAPSAGETAPASTPQESSASPAGKDTPPADKSGNKPVVVYIMILFIAAFLLMALSFFMHQRSNTEALGELQHSVSAIQEVQISQDKIIELQEALADAEEQLADLKEESSQKQDELQEELDTQEAAQEALSLLYCLQQEYSAKDYESCGKIIETMEDGGYAALLPQEVSVEGVTPPDERYQELKAAVEVKLA